MIKKLIPCLGKYKIYAVLTPLCVVMEVALDVYIPILMGRIINIGIYGGGGISYVFKVGVLMILMALLAMCFGALSGRFAALASTGFASGIRSKVFSKIQAFSFSNVDKFSPASLITRLTTDVTYAQMALTTIIRIAVRAPFMLVLTTTMAIRINAKLSLVFLTVMPILAVVLAVIITKAYPLFIKMLGKFDKLNASLQENLAAIRVVKAFVRRDYENEKFTKAATDLQIAQKKAEKLFVLSMPFVQLGMYICMIAVSWFGGNLIIRGGMQTGDLMTFISYIGQILMSLMMISMSFVMIVMSKASVSRIVEVLDELPDISDEGADPELEVRDGSISFDNVSFSYAKDKSNLTLESVNLEIKSGETIGIIGGTGSAKTTLVQLIPRLYDVFDGSLRVGGRDVRDYKLNNLRSAVAMVLQKNELFSGTIRDNLRWGDENATYEELIAACKAASAHNFIMSFPDGYDTWLGQGGVNVSGGQKQRLCIARALLRNPKILILDDSTSAVDTATDLSIRQALRENRGDTTLIIIAQRISSVADADRIIVLDNGKINAVGTHEQLLSTNDIYREVFESQQKGVA
ncbi:MAG: ABC transporter ATP-binding protein [Clostridiales bacterium]|nr:ABC transporter ATP-binding protein [Clostridiales bacterium]